MSKWMISSWALLPIKTKSLQINDVPVRNRGRWLVDKAVLPGLRQILPKILGVPKVPNPFTAIWANANWIDINYQLSMLPFCWWSFLFKDFAQIPVHHLKGLKGRWQFIKSPHLEAPVHIVPNSHAFLHRHLRWRWILENQLTRAGPVAAKNGPILQLGRNHRKMTFKSASKGS